jgi:hypothetical protein
MHKTIRNFVILLALLLPAQVTYAQSRDSNPDQNRLTQSDEVVDTFRLTSAYPNPFNPTTQFTLTLEQRQNVLIEVYNLLGRRVAQLHDGQLEAKERHTFTFEADNLPSGLYLIRTVGATFSNTQQVTLLK